MKRETISGLGTAPDSIDGKKVITPKHQEENKNEEKTH